MHLRVLTLCISFVIFLSGCAALPRQTETAVPPESPSEKVARASVPRVWDGRFTQPSRASLRIAEASVPAIEPVVEVEQAAISVADPLSAPQPVAKPAVEVVASPEVTADEDDVWQRLRAGFTFPSSTQQAEVDKWIRWYKKHPQHLEVLFARGQHYLKYIVDRVDERHIPMEVALLPAVESAFDPYAYSTGQAAGLWQFIPGTADRFKLERDWWYDGRRDVQSSTTAALDYLSYLARFFDGDWMLAMAAYNSGEGTVQRAVKKNRRAHKPTTFWHLGLPSETISYVPKVIALSELIRHPEKHGISLRDLPNQDVFAEVKIPSQIDLAQAAEMAEISIEQIQWLNPGPNRWATSPNGPHRLLLPVEAVNTFTAALAERGEKGLVRWERHQIASGENLIVLARRYDTTVSLIREINKISGNQIRAGQYLLIPVALRSFDEYPLSQRERFASALESAVQRRQATVHVVKGGDSFWSIARRYGVSVDKLVRWNKLRSTNVLRPGQKLVVHTATHRVSSDLKRIRYTVRSGDSLDLIARRFKVRISQICDWNTISSKEYLQPGQSLRLYVNPREMSS